MGFDEEYIIGFGWEQETIKRRQIAKDLKGFIWNLIFVRLSYVNLYCLVL